LAVCSVVGGGLPAFQTAPRGCGAGSSRVGDGAGVAGTKGSERERADEGTDTVEGALRDYANRKEAHERALEARRGLDVVCAEGLDGKP
jgi:hypothetical protein